MPTTPIAAIRGSRHQERPASRAAVARADARVANTGFANASANALAVSKRSAGTFSSARARAAATFAGTDFRNSPTGRAVSAMIFMMIAWAEPPVWGGSPASIS
jgi:hypothetical protein